MLQLRHLGDTVECISLALLSRRNVFLLKHGPENEITLVHQGVRYCQSFRIHHMIAMKQNIEVDVPRSFVDGFDTAEVLLDRLGSVEELLGCEGSFDLFRQR